MPRTLSTLSPLTKTRTTFRAPRNMSSQKSQGIRSWWIESKANAREHVLSIFRNAVENAVPLPDNSEYVFLALLGHFRSIPGTPEKVVMFRATSLSFVCCPKLCSKCVSPFHTPSQETKTGKRRRLRRESSGARGIVECLRVSESPQHQFGKMRKHEEAVSHMSGNGDRLRNLCTVNSRNQVSLLITSEAPPFDRH
jgi:hypothetical protein